MEAHFRKTARVELALHPLTSAKTRPSKIYPGAADHNAVVIVSGVTTASRYTACC